MKKKKMGRPVTTGTLQPTLVRMSPQLYAALDDWIGDREFNRPEAIRQLLSSVLLRPSTRRRPTSSNISGR